MSQTFRHPEILALARREGKVTVEGLSQAFGVSVQTIRRDLTDLVREGRLERVHGGAVLPSGTHTIAYAERRLLNEGAKGAIARQAADLIPNDAALFLGIGSTTEAVARQLTGHSGLLVVTNNLNIATILSGHPKVEVIVTGGSLRPSDGGLTGPLAQQTVAGLRVDLAILGCSALDPSGDILDFDAAEVAVSQLALARARRRMLVCDASKLRRTAPLRVAGLDQMEDVVTDAPLPPALVQRLDPARTRLHINPNIAP